MGNILFLAYTESDGSLAKSALEALSSAISIKDGLGTELTVGLIGKTVQAAADAVGGCGATRWLAVEGDDFAQSRYSTDAEAAEVICRAADASIVVVPGTSRASRVVAGVAHRLGGRADTHICEIGTSGSELQVTRWFYRQRMKAVLKRSQAPWFISCDPASQPQWEGPASAVSVEVVSTGAQKRPNTQVTGVQEPPAGEQTIRPDAELLFVAGAGWTKKQSDGLAKVDKAEGLILDFLGASKASLGGSKSMVDLAGEGQKVLSFMTHLNQIGQTGATPRHAKGLATCCHGEEPHVVGWRFINERRVINTDPNCGWAQGKADVLYVEDAFAVMAKVNELLAGD